MQFSFDIPTISIVLLSGAFAALAFILIFYCLKLAAVARRRKQCDAMGAPDASALPKASVILFARNEPETLTANLPAIMEQDYAPGFEVIIVNEGASADTDFAVGILKNKYPNIYLTFTPDGARNLSRKKLALTLAIKAAKGDVVVITDPCVKVDSNQWLAQMMRQFADPATEVVLGHGLPLMPKRKMWGRKARNFDMAQEAATWISAALTGHPYRGCGFNIAYRRELFFDNKGFSRSLNLREGDDDIFINEITNRDNTKVELAADSIVYRESNPYMRTTRDYQISHEFTGKRLPHCPRRMMAAGEWAMWLVVGLSIAGAWTAGVCNAFGWAVAAILIIGMLVMVGAFWRRAMLALGGPKMALALPFLAMTRPLRWFILKIQCAFSHEAQYSWQ